MVVGVNVATPTVAVGGCLSVVVVVVGIVVVVVVVVVGGVAVASAFLGGVLLCLFLLCPYHTH